ncbi:FKBP12-associated protein 1 [Metarhizium anisopliae]
MVPTQTREGETEDLVAHDKLAVAQQDMTLRDRLFTDHLVATSPAKPTKPKTFAKPQVRLPKSTAEDLGTRIHEDIRNFNYECAICTDDVVRTSHVWSCTLCWTVVHLKCVRKCPLSLGKCLLGDVQGATRSYLTTPGPITVGAERISTPIQHLHLCLHILVVKRARNRDRHVHTRALFSVMPGPVRPVA